MARTDDNVWSLRQAVERQTTTADSVRTLVRGIHRLLGHAISADANPPPGVRVVPFANTQALLDAIGAQSDVLAAATMANTPPTVTAPKQTPEEKAAAEHAEVDSDAKRTAIANAEAAVRTAASGTDEQKAAAQKTLDDANAMPGGELPDGGIPRAGWTGAGAYRAGETPQAAAARRLAESQGIAGGGDAATQAKASAVAAGEAAVRAVAAGTPQQKAEAQAQLDRANAMPAA